MRRKLILLVTLFLVVTPNLIFSQDLQQQIDSWTVNLRIIVKSIIGLAAIGGGVFAYFKMQTDDGSNGKKALLSFLGALIFAALMWPIIDFFLA